MKESQDEAGRRLRHDLANPLSAILAEAQLLLLNEDSMDGETARALKEIERLARHMREMLQRDW